MWCRRQSPVNDDQEYKLTNKAEVLLPKCFLSRFETVVQFRLLVSFAASWWRAQSHFLLKLGFYSPFQQKFLVIQMLTKQTASANPRLLF